MTPRRLIGCTFLVALALASASAAAARPAICVVVDPLVDIGCQEDGGGSGGGGGAGEPPTAGAQSTTPDADQLAPVRESSTVPRYDPNRIAVTVKRGTSLQKVREIAARAGTTVEEAVPKLNAYLLGVDPERRAEALRSLRSSSAVASAAQELISEALDTTPDDSDWPLQEGLRVAGFPKAWDVTRGSGRVVVAVLDSGVDSHQADLRGALVPGRDFVNSDADPADDQGHGTAVAGVIAARANNHEGAAGICWRCSVMPVKVLDSHGSGDDTLIAAGIVWAVDHGAQVINMSLGGPATSEQLSAAVGYAADKGVIVVAAAGNSGSATPFYPAADSRVLSVAGTTFSDRRYSWSNFGSWVNVAAPGCNVAPVLSGGYGWFCGTSSATPLVTGLVALELSATPTASREQIESALLRAAVPLPNVVQYGRIDAGRTLSLLPTAEQASPATAVFRGTIGPRTRTRTYRLDLGTGTLTAKLRFSGGARLTLAATNGSHISGKSPLELRTSVDAGAVTLRVSGTAQRKISFVLSVSYPKTGTAVRGYAHRGSPTSAKKETRHTVERWA
jgi:subtilisin family serine protease